MLSPSLVMLSTFAALKCKLREASCFSLRIHSAKHPVVPPGGWHHVRFLSRPGVSPSPHPAYPQLIGYRRRTNPGILVEANGDDLRYAFFLHRDAIERAGRLHGTLVVRDHDELRVVGEFLQDAGEPVDIGVVEGGIDFIEDTERAGFYQVYGEQKCNGCQGFSPAGEQVYRRRTLAAGLRDDLDVRLQRIDSLLDLEVALVARLKQFL